MKKRLLAVFMALCLTIGVLPISVVAVETENLMMTVGDTRTIDCGRWAGLDPVGVDEYWKNSDYRFVQITNYNYLGGEVTFKAISPGTTTIILYKDKGQTQVDKVWKVTVEEDHKEGVYYIFGEKRDSFTFSKASSNVEVAYSYIVDQSNNACSDLIPLELGETIRLPGTAGDYPVAFYVRASKGYVPAGSSFECAGSQGYYDPIGTNSSLPMAQQAKDQGYTKEFSFSSRKSGYPDREFKITATPVKVSVQYDGGASDATNVPQNNSLTYAHKNVTEISNHVITVSDQRPTRTGYVFMGWKISTDGIRLSTRETYQSGEQIELNDNTWLSADKENAIVTFTAQWEKDDNNDGIPDIYQATVTYCVENGTWNGTDSEPKQEVFDLWEKNSDGTWSKIHPAPTLSNTIPTGMTANSGYEGGRWSDTISGDTPVKTNITYTYSFAAKQTYTLTYDASGGYWGTAENPVTQKKETGLPTAQDANSWHTLIYCDTSESAVCPAPVHDLISENGKEIKVLFVGWSLAEEMNGKVLGKDDQPDGLINTGKILMDQSHTVYAVWAKDTNGNGRPDYQETNITVTFDPGAGVCSGTKDFILQPFPNQAQFFYPPTVTPPQDQTLVNWTLQGNTEKALGKQEPFTYDSIFALTGGQDEVTFVANYQAEETITITPVSMTVYMGGTGYTGVVEDQTGDIVTAENNGFPEPGFIVTLPESLKNVAVTDLTLRYMDQAAGQNYQWKFKPYDGENGSSTIYRIVPTDTTEKRSVRIQFTNAATGEIFHSDTFAAGRNLNQTLKMEVYGEGIESDKVSFLYNGQSYGIAVGEATLTVRGTTSAVLFSNDENSAQALPQFIAPAETTYTINGSEVKVANAEGVALLFDDILNSEGTTDRIDLLKTRATNYFQAQNISASTGNIFTYQFKYLDLVDTNNGNAWVNADKDVTVYWPLPDNADTATVRVLHYRGVDRSDSDADIAEIIKNCTVEDMQATVENGFAKFTVSSGNFSPFALVWETKAPDPGSVTLTYYPNGGSGSANVYTYTKGTSTTAMGNMFSRGYYVFTGWNTAANGSGTAYAPGAAITLNGNMELYAQWRYVGGNSDSGSSDSDDSDDYTLYYHSNFGSDKRFYQSGDDSRMKVRDYDDMSFLPQREGYIFLGWNTREDGRGEDYEPGDTYRLLNSTAHLYAQWEKDGFTLDETGVSRWLETEEHNAYLSGYPDGTFGPDKNMTRAEVAQMFYALLKDKNVAVTASFSDVPADAWYARAVNTLASLGMLGGYPDGTFRPDAPITRAEFTAIALAFAYDPADASCSYTDVSAGAWYYTYVAQATTYGWIGGYPNGTFRPNNSITRAEVCVIVNNMLGRSADERYVDRNGDELVSFSDLNDNHWAYYTIMEATNTHDHTKDGSEEVWETIP